jgi:hypothetical protein
VGDGVEVDFDGLRHVYTLLRDTCCLVFAQNSRGATESPPRSFA